MDIWGERLADVDDDYLIGLSNKGIVKRAYKDKSEVAAEVLNAGEEASVTVGGETVTVRYPLGESRCSCPSRSICRHVIQAILVLKENSQKEGAGGTQAAEPEKTESVHGSEISKAGTVQAAEQDKAKSIQAAEAGKAECVQGAEQGKAEPVQAAETGETEPVQAAEQGKAGAVQVAEVVKPESEQSVGFALGQAPSGAHRTAVMKEIEAYPFPKLKKALGTRNLQSFANQLSAGVRPEINYASVVTVRAPGSAYTVKLLSPLEYSSCTCHKKELCAHKAAAILWCQVEAGILAGEMLQEEALQAPSIDMEEVRKAAGQMWRFLEELLATGLSRSSADVPDSLERLAIISHNAGLAGFEGYFRALADSYDRYLMRKAAFRPRDLMGQMARLYQRTEKLLEAEDGKEVSKLAGEFRADYLPVGNLDLVGIAMEQFRSQSGYEGETVYFLEENTGKWYTYTNARPVFYDSHKRRGYVEKSPAPWGLNLSFENLLKARIRLTGAKSDNRGRLSSSRETKGEARGSRGLGFDDIKIWYYRDFKKLFLERIGRQERGWLAQQEAGGYGREQAALAQEGFGNAEGGGQYGTELVFVQPDSCGKAEFSQTGQMLSLPLYDKAGRELLVEVTYSKQEASTIRYLERISEKKCPCFLGKVFLRDGRMRMYPVDLPEIEEDTEREGFPQCGESEKKQGASGKFRLGFRKAGAVKPEEKGLAAEKKDAECPDFEGQEAAQEGQEAVQEGNLTGRKGQYEALEDITEEILSILEDLFQSGFSTVHDSTLEDITRAAKVTEQYGMEYLSELLSGLAEEITAGRHQMERKTTPMAKLYTRLNEYLYLCGQKTAYDKGKRYYTGGHGRA